mgnify:CR=1 FL=1
MTMHQATGLAILGTGRALPKREASSAELDRTHGYEPGWLEARTGVATRYFCDHENQIDLAAELAVLKEKGYDRTMSLEDAVKLLMVSFDSTLKANLSVGLPLDLQVIERDVFEPKHEHRVNHDDPYFQAISSSWGDALKNAFHSLPDYSFYRED